MIERFLKNSEMVVILNLIYHITYREAFTAISNPLSQIAKKSFVHVQDVYKFCILFKMTSETRWLKFPSAFPNKMGKNLKTFVWNRDAMVVIFIISSRS